MSYKDKIGKWSEWTAQDHADHNRDAEAQALRIAQANGYKTAAAYDRAQSILYNSLNYACDTRFL